MKNKFETQKIFNKLLNFAKSFISELLEDQIRIFLGYLAEILPYGGISALANATGISRNTISNGMREVSNIFQDNFIYKAVNIQDSIVDKVVNHPSTKRRGRPRAEEKQPLLYEVLYLIIEETLYYDNGDQVYTSLSLREISTQLKEQGYNIAHSTVADKLEVLGVKVQKKNFSRHQQEKSK